LATAAAVALGVGVLAVAGRLLPTTPSAQSPPTTASVSVLPDRPAPTTIPTVGVRVPQVIGRTLAQARAIMREAGLSSGAHERDPQTANAVVVAQEPPSGAWVPPNSRVGVRTRTDVWPNGRPRRLRLGPGPTVAAYRVVVADPMHHPVTVAITMPATVDFWAWLDTGPSRRLPVLDSADGSGTCRPVSREFRCQVRLEALHEEPGVWTVSLAKRSTQPAAIQITVTF